MKNFYFLVVLFFMFFSSQVLFADSYENYRQYRDSSNADYITETKTNEPWGIYDGLRNSIKDEVNRGLLEPDSMETNSDLDETIRKIVREEIKKTLQRERKKYLTAGVFEIGGYVSGQLHSPYSGTGGNRTDTILTAGVMNIFIINNLALSFKGEGDFDITNNHQLYYIGIGPMFAFGLDSSNQIAVYFSIHGCFRVNSFFKDKYRQRYANEIGFKLGLGRAILNIGLSVGFENDKMKSLNFTVDVNPMIGITTWL